MKKILALAFLTTIAASAFPAGIEFGKDNIRGFTFDNVLHSDSDGDIHFGLYIPKTYDGKESYVLFVTLPGYEGLHFQGVGRNIKAEDYGIEAQKYNAKMIVVAPQLSDWRMTSAKQTVTLTKYFLEHYNIDQTKVYLNGYSGGGETGSLVMQIAPELYTAFLHCSSQWDGELDPLVRARTPVYLVTGRNDTYYGSSSVQKTYRTLVELYKKEGLSEDQIKKLVTIDLKEQSYFEARGVKDQHGGGGLFAHDKAIMGWLFGEHEASMNNRPNQTGFTQPVSSEYIRQASQKGSVTRLNYNSKDYAGNGKAITKTAYVYTPYGYNEKGSERYDILYLMHGWGGHAGEYFEMAEIKSVFDNMILKGQIKPLIVVSATFYNANSGSDFGSSVAELRSFHNDFEKHLMPAVEGKYRTYAASTSAADLKASRDHRAFGGFSLGSVTTWLELCYDSDYISSFIPMSGSSWYYGGFGDFQIKKNVDFIENLVRENKLNERGYFIYHAVGTNDAVKEQSFMMADEMLSRKTFSQEHYRFFQKQGGVHDHIAVREFLYNALPVIFPKKQTSESNNLVLVKGGTFLSTSDTKNPDDYRQHRETVEDFYISKYEVTVALYKSVTGKNPTSARDGTDEMNRPVENISGYDCIDFLNALSRLEGFEECYSLANGKWTCDFSKNGYRLPTLPEWEYAACGGSLSKGYKYSGSDRLSEVGWYDENSGGHAHQVGLLKPNELGLYDMSGNVGERCWNPSYKGENPAHVGRGGCWIYYEGYCTPDYRFVTTENFKQDGLGIRLVRSKI